MGKKLSEMTLEELWHLFPIFLTEHKKSWDDDYKEIKNKLDIILSKHYKVNISHIGSTAIDGIWAKPIIDVLIETDRTNDIKDISSILIQNGFTCMCSDSQRISLCLGYTENGFADKVYHIHLRYSGDNNELYFRDYLNESPKIAKEYEELKLSLWKQYEFDRDGYTNAKGDFINQIVKKAKDKYKNRYN